MSLSRDTKILLGLAVLLALIPVVTTVFDQGFYLGFARRVLIYALLATSLNFILGFGGMVALGHAAFFGVGAYASGIMAVSGVNEFALLALGAALAAGLAAALVGAISLRTKGVYFIMITLAFAQMFYYFFVSLKEYGGDDGLNLPGKATLLGIPLSNELAFYGLVALLTLLLLALQNWILARPFGQILTGIRENAARMETLGTPVRAVQWFAFTAAGAVAGLCGALIAQHNVFISPSLMHWTQSATLIVMVIVGGVGLRYGALLGAAAWLLLEEVLKGFTEYWHFTLGLVLLALVFLAPRGIAGLLRAARKTS
jgi:branched-chain amino acid transport system permease protein